MHSSILSLTSAMDGGGWLTLHLGRFPSGKETRYTLYRRLGGPQAGLDGCGKSRPNRNSIPGRPAHRSFSTTVEPLITDTAGEFKFCPL